MAVQMSEELENVSESCQVLLGLCLLYLTPTPRSLAQGFYSNDPGKKQRNAFPQALLVSHLLASLAKGRHMNRPETKRESTVKINNEERG